MAFSSKNYGHLHYLYDTNSLLCILLIKETENPENRELKTKNWNQMITLTSQFHQVIN
jgi:hypothetical protein